MYYLFIDNQISCHVGTTWIQATYYLSTYMFVMFENHISHTWMQKYGNNLNHLPKNVNACQKSLQPIVFMSNVQYFGFGHYNRLTNQWFGICAKMASHSVV